MIDPQQNKVYRWEDEVVAPYDTKIVPFDQLQMIVDYIWSNEGLKFPPKVVAIPKQTRKAEATGSRTRIQVHDRGTKTWVLIHELSHSMTSDLDGASNWHGALFVGVYMKLLEKYLHIPLPILMHTAKKSEIRFDITAKPVFKD